MIHKNIYQFLFLVFLIFTQGCKEMSSLTATNSKNSSPTIDLSSLTLNIKNPTIVEVNQCVPLIISQKNSVGDQVAAGSNLSISIQGDLGILYSDSICTIAQSSTVSISKNTLSKIIYAKPISNQSYIFEIQESLGVVKPHSSILTVTNPITNIETLKLSLSGPTSLVAGQCRSYVVSLQNALGANKNSTSNMAVTLSGGASGFFYNGTNCSGGAISSLTLLNGSSFVSFSYIDSIAENVNLVADSPMGSGIQSGFYSVQVNSISATPPSQLLLSGPSSITAGACSGPVVVRSVDSSYNSTATAANINLTISGGAGFSAFTNAACTTALTTPLISAGNSSTSFYYIAASAGNFVIGADDSGPLTDGALSVQATASSGTSAVKITLSGPSSVNALACSAAFVVKSANGSGVESPVNATTTINITGKGTGDFYSDASCTSIISSLTFASGDSSKPFYFKGLNVANLTFNVDDPGPLTPASVGVAIVADLPSQFFISGPTPINLGDCRAYTVTTKDVNGFITVVAGTTSVNLTGAGAGAYYLDSSCVSSTSSIVINSGQSSSLFYYKNNSASSVTLSADNSGTLTTATKAVTVDPLPYTKVVFGRPVLSAGTCTLVTLTLKDSLNNISSATSAVGISLSNSGSANFYTASNCLSGLVTSATILTAQSSTNVYVKDVVAENLTFTATSTGLTSDSWNANILAGSNNTLKVTGPATNSVGSCTAYDLRLEDALGNLSAAASSVSVNFSGLLNSKFYSDVNCTSLASSITLAAANSLTQIYLKDNVAENISLTASSGALVPATKSISIIAGSSNKLVFNGVASAFAGDCSILSIEAQDSFNNPINQASALLVNLSGNAGGSFYSNSGCSVVASTATIPMSNSSVSTWYKSNIPASLSFTAQSGGLFDANKNFTINPLAPTKLVLTGSANITSGICTAYSISLQDTLNNLSATGNSKTLNFSGGGAGAFYSDSNCSLSAASISLTNSQTTAQIYYKASSAQSVNLTVDDSGLPDLAFSILPVTVAASGGAATIALKISGSTSINNNTCVPYAVMTTDTSGLSYNVTSNTTVTMGGAGSGVFYSDSGCTSSQTTVSILNGSSLGYIYYKSATAQNLVFSASATGISTTTIPVAVVSGSGAATVSRLTIAGSSSILTNNCVPYVISVADVNGNSMNAAGNTPVTFSGMGLGAFYTEDSCTTSAAGATTILSGSSYSTVYYKNGIVQNLILIAQSTGLSNGTLALSIASTSGAAVSGPAVKLTFVAQPSLVASVSENFGVQPIIAIQDSNNNVASTASNTITLSAYTDSSCTLSAGSVLAATANPINANGGIANFSGVNITSAQVVYLKAASTGLASACSQAIQVYPTVAAKLSFSVQPSNSGTAGIDLVTQPQISILNYTNQVVTNATNIISLSAYTDSGCSQVVPGVFNIAANGLIPTAGIVNFTGINYSLPATIYLKATSSGLTSTCSSGISIAPAAPYRIGIFAQPPTMGMVGSNISLTVRLYDSYGSLSPAAHNLVATAYKTNNCTGSTSSITGGTKTSTLGTANFSTIVFSETGPMSLKISDSTDPSVLTVCTSALTIDGGAPTKLIFSVQPSSTARAYTSLPTAPIIQVQDSFSNLISNATNQVTISAFTDASCTSAAGGTLSAQSLTSSPSYGQATFSNVYYTLNQTIYLKATSPGLTSACSTAIVISSMANKMASYNGTTCSIMNGGVWCWGDNTTNKIGDGQVIYADRIGHPSQVVGVGGVGYLSNISEVAIGIGHVCAVSTAGAVYCWGRNDYGQIGDNTVTYRLTPVQVLGVGGVGNLANVVSVTASYLHSCALTSAGNVYCWGYNGHGQMGDNTTTARYTPVQVQGVGGVGNLSSITAISAKDYHDCALNSSGSVYCWGYNGYGQTGYNDTTARNTPVQVKGVGGVGNLANVVSLASGGDGSYGFNCAAINTGAVYCWGYGGNYNMGDLGASSRYAPVQVVGVGGTGTLANIVSVAAGGYHACAINNAGASYCWGYNAQTQLGNNSTTASGSPIQTPGVGGTGNLSGLIGIVAATYNSCAYSTDGSMYCWGQNTYAQLGDQTFTASRVYPVKVRDINTGNFTSVSVGYNNACGVAREKVYCWGYGANGELGDGTTTGRLTPGLVSNLSGVKQVSMGQNHGCAVLKTGELYCWGYNNWGMVGDNSVANRLTPTQVVGVGGVGYLTNIVSVSAGNYHTCAVNGSGSVFCWGNNGNGMLGDNTSTERHYPVQVLGENAVGFLSNIISVSVGYNHSCALSGAGAMYCWGYNGYGQLGDNSATAHSTPNQVSGMASGVTAISSGHTNSCAIKNGAGYCWGYVSYANTNTNYYQIGTTQTPQLLWASGVTSITAGTETVSVVVNGKVRSYSPVAYYAYNVAGAGDSMNDAVMISQSTKVYGHPMYCALRNNGTIYCWGYNNYYGIYNTGYNGSMVYPSVIVQPVYTDKISSAVATGENHSCANVDGLAQCWGASSVGALGSGLSNSLTAKPVLLASSSTNLGGQLSFGAGSNHTCSLSYGGEVFCWGDNTSGKLGNNSSIATNKAVKVFGVGGTGNLASVTNLSVGLKHNCAISLGNVYCWGNNSSGQLGINSTLSMGTPVQTKGVAGVGYLIGATQVAAGANHTCVLKAGNVYCYGSNSNGQLGANSAVAQSNVPLQVVSVSGMGVLDNVTSITAGANHTCAIADGITYCWGLNTSKQLGNDSFTDSSYPVGVMNAGYVTLTGVNSVSAGLKHTCATTSLNEVLCWGAGANGQIGNNATIDMGVATNVVGVGAVGFLSVGSIGSGSSSNHTCAVSPDQANIFCWGLGASGQIGNGLTNTNQMSPGITTISTPINFIVR